MTPSALRPATLPRPAYDAAQPAALRERLASHLQRRGALAVLVLMAALASATSSTFPTWSNISSILGNNAFVWLLALGMTFVILTGGIDLSVGSVYALGGVLGAYGAHAGGTWLAVVLPLAVGALWGTAQGLLVARARMAPFIVTLAGLLGARGLLQALTNEGATTYLVPAGSAFRRLGDGTWVPVLLVAALFGSGALLLTRTRFGAT
ncbi:ABC transporter permease, partial [Streptomyces sp. SID6139]|uniref:ABC transporter permease subunit n=1 Tax=Streptomyces sp. SID6139 TaxID=2690320 RepID=UPI00136AAE12|nr:ABC transporter permease [Streptomyces sp. SID6139]